MQRANGLNAVLAKRRRPPTIQAAELEGTLVLLVDDHPTVRLLIARQLDLLGYAAETAADGLQALEAWRTGRFGAIIADCNMPLMTGYELSRAIRADELGGTAPRIPILAFTANAFSTEAAACLEAGMDDFLVKPVTLAELAARLDRWLPLEAAAELIDQELLGWFAKGDKELELDLLGDFRRSNDKDAEMLRKAVVLGDFAQISHFSHRIAGACLMMGVSSVVAVCRSIESNSRAGDLLKVCSEHTSLRYELRHLDRYLDAKLVLLQPTGAVASNSGP